MTKTVLLTGVGGFIGAHTVRYLLEHTDWNVIGIESWNPQHVNSAHRLQEAVKGLETQGRLELIQWDLTHQFTPSIVHGLSERVDIIISMASDSRVTHSVAHPQETWRNNCLLISNMLELARAIPRLEAFIQVSTDEVYGDADWDSPGHPEWDTILPSNPYSASKAAQEALAISYWRTYKIPLIITNTMNVIGEWQDPEKFLPLAIKRITNAEPVPLFADDESKNVSTRVWLDARNMAAALTHICQTFKPAAYGTGVDRPLRFHVVGDTELSVYQLASKVADMLDKPLLAEIVSGDDVRPGYDKRYALQDNHLQATGYKPPYTFNETLRRVIQWAKEHPNWVFARE